MGLKGTKETKESLLFSFTYEYLFNNHSNLEDIIPRTKSYLKNSSPCAFNRGNSTVVPSNHIHIFLIKLKLQSNILDDRMAAKVINLIKTITNKYKTILFQIFHY